MYDAKVLNVGYRPQDRPLAGTALSALLPIHSLTIGQVFICIHFMIR